MSRPAHMTGEGEGVEGVEGLRGLTLQLSFLQGLVIEGVLWETQ